MKKYFIGTIMIAIVLAFALWGCPSSTGNKEEAKEEAKEKREIPLRVISLPDLAMQSLLQNPGSRDSVWYNQIMAMRGMDQTLRNEMHSGGTQLTIQTMSVCCICRWGGGCCACPNDSLQNIRLVAPPQFKEISIYSDSSKTSINLKPNQVQGVSVYTLEPGIKDGKYKFKIEGSFNPKGFSFPIIIKDNQMILPSTRPMKR